MRSLLAAILLAAAMPAAALAQSPLNGPGLAPPPAQSQISTAIQPATAPRALTAVDENVAFNHTEQWLIPLYFERVRNKQKRAARQKRYERVLPAGLTAIPAQGSQLPPSVLAEAPRLPGPLLRDLPPARPGTERIIIGKDVMMVRTANGEVLDVLTNIIF